MEGGWILLLLLLLLLLVSCGGTSSSSPPRPPAVLAAFRPLPPPPGGHFLSLPVRNSQQCYTLCQRTSPCKALTFDPETEYCSLYVTPLQDSGETTPSQGDVIWYARLEEPGTESPALALYDGCQSDSCQSGHVCLKKSSASTTFTACLLLTGCGKPPRLAHSQSDYTSTVIQSTASYQCDVSYVFEGANNTVVCGEDVTWSPLQGYCRANCSLPRDLPAASVSYSHTLEGATATYVCDVGYEFKGDNSTAVCDSDTTWRGLNGTCEIVDCGPPRQLRGARVMTSSTVYQSQATYECWANHSLVGPSPSSTCGPDGVWTSFSGFCTANCGPPPNVTSAQSFFTSTLEGANTTFSCDVGYNFTGSNSSVTCQSNGTWSELDGNCTIVDCGPPGHLKGAQVMTSSTVYQSQATYECWDNHSLVGPSPSSTCGPDGIWTSFSGFCIADCGPPPNATSAQSFYSSTLEGAIATYSCDVGYNFTGDNSNVTCQLNGAWSELDGNCTVVMCGPPPTVANSTLLTFGEDFPYQSQVGYICCGNLTFEDGVALAECGPDGTWTGPNGSCSACPKSKGYSYLANLGLCYKAMWTAMSWTDARQACKDEGGDLAVPNTQTKWTLFYEKLKANGTKAAWVGGSDLAVEGVWTWVDGSAFHITWTPGEPNGGDRESCLLINSLGTGNDGLCSDALAFFCQIFI